MTAFVARAIRAILTATLKSFRLDDRGDRANGIATARSPVFPY
ncbi:MAG TPA: hypothetical protein VMP08_00730 [Anaerolineae bacterium]|nr:hypothetical protein [Anaerolineae bacterium]